MSVHVAFQVLFTKLRDYAVSVVEGHVNSKSHLKDEHKLGFGVDDIVKANNIDVLEFYLVMLERFHKQHLAPPRSWS